MKTSLVIFLLLASNAMAANFSVSSSSFKDGATLPMESVFNSFGCKGKNVSPQLSWKNAPKETKSFAVTVYDPDAPTGSGWWHWTVVNLPANTTSLAKGAGNDPKKLPAGAIQGRTDFGKSEYGGACPPEGEQPHHYIFTVYALKTDKLDLSADSSGAMVGYNLNFNTLAKASITAMYGRSK